MQPNPITKDSSIKLSPARIGIGFTSQAHIENENRAPLRKKARESFQIELKEMTRLLLLLPLRLSFLKPQPQFQAPLPCLFQTLLTPNGRSSGVSNRNSLFYGFTSFCTARDLTAKKCVPCNLKDLRPMAEESATALMSKVDGWDLVKEDGVLKLNRSLKVKSFTKGLQLFQIVGNLAEAEGHHPDLHLVGWNNVKIEIWTHAVGGLTENDFILAAKINGLNLHDLLRKKAGT